MTHKEDNINNKYKQPINNNINKLILPKVHLPKQ